MSRTLLFYTQFLQIRNQIKAKTPMYIAKHTELFLCLPFLKYSIFFLVRQNFFGRVYITSSSSVSSIQLTAAQGSAGLRLFQTSKTQLACG